MTISQTVDVRCLHCDNSFELLADQVIESIDCGSVKCPNCRQTLSLKEADVAKLLGVIASNKKAMIIFGSLAVGVPVVNIFVLIQWGATMGFLSFFAGLLICACLFPTLGSTSFIRLDLDVKADAAQI